MTAKSTMPTSLLKKSAAAYLVLFIVALVIFNGCSNPELIDEQNNSIDSPENNTPKNQNSSAQDDAQSSEEQVFAFDGIENTSMFDGENLGLWEQAFFQEEFYEQGNVYVEDGCIVLEQGDWMTGVNWTGPYKTSNYRMYFEAKRTAGDDFFCTLTFPVGESFCSLVIGGWANQVAGISNINGRSANENESSKFFSLLDNVWYRVYLEVTDASIQAWIDEVPLFRVNREEDKIIDVRSECEPSVPLGFATYQSTGVIRNIQYYILQ